MKRKRHRPVLIRQTETGYKIGLLFGFILAFAGLPVAACCETLGFAMTFVGGFVTLVSAFVGFLRTG